MNLTELLNGQEATVTALSASPGALDDAQLRRLGELGFLPGEPVKALRRGPGGREPIAVRVGDTLIALRWVEAACVQVVPA